MTSASVLLVLASVALPVVQAQPSNSSPNQFGDRQVGKWGDPGEGHFGNPAAGDFDKSQIKVPPPGTRPLGRVYNGKPPEGSPYISLPEPADAAAPVEAAPKPKTNKKPAKKRAVKR